MRQSLDFWHGAGVSAIGIGLGARALDYLTGTDTRIVATPALCIGIFLYTFYIVVYWRRHFLKMSDSVREGQDG
jgi:hypothetical protein